MTAVAARLKLRNWLQLRRFFVVNRAVERQLETTSGLISYSRYDRIRARCDRACLAHQDGDGAPSEGLHFVDHEMGHRAELHREQPGQRHRGGSVASLYSGMSLASQPTDDTSCQMDQCRPEVPIDHGRQHQAILRGQGPPT